MRGVPRQGAVMPYRKLCTAPHRPLPVAMIHLKCIEKYRDPVITSLGHKIRYVMKMERFYLKIFKILAD